MQTRGRGSKNPKMLRTSYVHGSQWGKCCSNYGRCGTGAAWCDCADCTDLDAGETFTCTTTATTAAATTSTTPMTGITLACLAMGCLAMENK